ncbi:MAG TPA: tRNA guanosine(34) transglycosylase Tgt [Acidimicrobiales bacterium]|nr:tRNA guanosine(34) transglycosylase Tgt [Acidimicrobiales bacterium]
MGDDLLELEIDAIDGAARAGRVHTPRGSFETPVFMPVGTRGTVRAISSIDLEALGAEILLGNTYHLMLRPGADVVDDLGGLHGFMAWSGHVLTDSGGFQIYSLEPDVSDEGAIFRSTYDGSTHHLTPERAVEVQRLLGADIQMVLDVCPALPATADVLRTAVERTASWARRGRAAFLAGRDAGRSITQRSQVQFGIVQGGADAALRVESAQRTVEVGFDGYAVGGLSVGETREEMLPALAAATDHLPADRPRYLMGVGDPLGFVEGIALGVDMFDCVLATRLARHGTILTSQGRLNLRNAAHARSPEPLDPACSCEVCGRWSRGYLRHLLMVAEPTGPRLLTLHNVHWCLELMRRARDAIRAGRFEALRAEIASVWAV